MSEEEIETSWEDLLDDEPEPAAELTLPPVTVVDVGPSEEDLVKLSAFLIFEREVIPCILSVRLRHR